MFATQPCSTLKLKDQLITFDLPKIMGIINITTDSFYDGGKYINKDQVLARAKCLIQDGVDIFDIGAQSTRPNATLISADEESSRLLPIIEMIRNEFPDTPISIDTFRASVASDTIQQGAHMINDISGGDLDNHMFATISKLQVPYVLSHTRGTPTTMQLQTEYNDVVTDIAVDLGNKISRLRQLGVKDVVIDPGFGFAKNEQQNYELLHRINELHYFHLPILAGISRKSMIYKKLHISPAEALNGTTVLHTILLHQGVQMLRVHDVKEARQIIDLLYH